MSLKLVKDYKKISRAKRPETPPAKGLWNLCRPDGFLSGSMTEFTCWQRYFTVTVKFHV
jgi:hypothetical protein